MPKNLQKWRLCLILLLLVCIPSLRRWGLTVALALGLAAALHPPVHRLMAHRFPRWAAILTVLTALALALGLFLWAAASRLCCGATRLTELFTTTGTLSQGLDTLLSHLPKPLAELVSSLRLLLAREGSALYERFLSWAGKAGAAFVAALPRLMLRLVIVVLGAVYALSDWDRVRGFLLRQIPEDWLGVVRSTLHSLGSGVSTWLKAQGTLAAIQCGILLAGFLLLRIPSPVTGAVLIALADALPLIGSGLILAPWAALSWLEGANLRAMGLAVLWLILWAARTMLEPRLLGRRAGTNAFSSLIVIYLGWECFGVAGLLCAPVLLAAGMELKARQEKQSFPQ